MIGFQWGSLVDGQVVGTIIHLLFMLIDLRGPVEAGCWDECRATTPLRGVPPQTPASAVTGDAPILLQPIAGAAHVSTWATGRGGSPEEMHRCGRFQVALGDILCRLYSYYTSSVDMGTNLLGDMVKPCQGHTSHSQPQVSGQPPPRSPSGPPCFSVTGTHLSHSGFLGIVYTGG